MGMIRQAQKCIDEHQACFERKNIRFEYACKDANHFSVEDWVGEEMSKEEGYFDRVIANHMLYHVSDKQRPELLHYCSKLLGKDGMFAASTVGAAHLQQLYELVHRFDDTIHKPDWMTGGFELENGEAQLTHWFKNVTVEEQNNDLLVPDPEAIYQYLCSLPGEIKSKIMEQERTFRIYLKSQISADNPFFIHKSTGIFRAYKK